MTAILAILFAASLHSTDIGEFFTMPAWLPSSVSSANTPGSDPAAGGGWYTDEPYYTNAFVRVSDWIIESDEGVGEESIIEGVLTFHPKESYFDDTWWYVSSVQRWPDPAYDPDTETWSRELAASLESGWAFADEDAMSLDFWLRRGIYEYYGGTWYLSTKEYVCYAYRTNEYQRVLVHDFKPRAARLTPEIQSGLISTFAGYAERQYYAAQGQSNVWNVADWGPRSNRRAFRFFEDYDGYNYIEFVFEPTNRVINTRRLTLYDDFDGLADILCSVCVGDFTLRAPPRPGWNCGWSWNGSPRTHGDVFWGTTASAVPNDADILPTLNWVSNPIVASNWRNRSRSLSSLASAEPWPINYNVGPTYCLMSQLGFGQPNWEDNLENANPTNLAATVTDILAEVYPHSDGDTITNATRRLVSDRICTENQVLGLMDRTYCVPDIAYPSVYTNTTYANGYTWSGSQMPRLDDVRLVDGKIEITFPDAPLAWVSGSRHVETNESGTAEPTTHTAYRMTATCTGVRTYYSGGGLGWLKSSEAMVRSILAGIIEPSFTCDFVISVKCDGGINYYFDDDGKAEAIVKSSISLSNGRSGTYNVDLPFSIGTISNVNYAIDYSRHYTHTKPQTFAGLRVTQPGQSDGFARSSSSYGFIVATHERDYDTLGNTSALAYAEDSVIGYKSVIDTYDSRADLVLDFDVAQGLAVSRFSNHYGLEPSNWPQIIQLDMTDVNAVRDSLRISKATLTFATAHTMTGVFGHADNGNISITSVETYNSQTGEFTPGYAVLGLTTLAVTDTYSSPQQVERDPLAMDVKLGVLTRTDWDWKTLKRTDD